MTSNRLIFLGTGSSTGAPLIGCTCSVCLSNSSFNKRLRPAAYIEYCGKRFLIDAGPDLRQQALTHHLTELDGVILTHAHYDHTGGIDDLRPFYFSRSDPLPVLLSQETEQDIKHRFHYIFSKEGASRTLSLQVLPNVPAASVKFQGVDISFVTYEQAKMGVNGYRFGDLAYISDIRHFSDNIFDELTGVRYLILSALRFTHSFLHLSIDEAIDFSKRVGAEKVWFTHLSHELDYEQTNSYLPSHIRLAFDGLAIEF